MAGKSAILSVKIVSQGRDAERGLDRAARKLDDVGKASAKSGVELSRMYKTLDGMSSAALKVGALASALGSLTSHTAGIARGMAPVVGLTAALPGVLGVAAASIGTFRVATGGFADALKAAEKGEKEFAEATAGMADSMRDTVRTVAQLRDSYSGDVRAVQESFWSGLDSMISTVADGTLPRLFSGMQSTAGVMNGLAKALGRATVEAANLGVIESVFGATDRVLSSLTPAIGPVVRGLALITRGSADLIGGIDSAADAGMRFEQWASRVASDGSLGRWLGGGVEASRQIGSVLGSLTSILGSVMRAASEAGGAAGLAGFAESLDRIAEAAATPEVQAAMRDAFTTANTVMRTATTVIVALLPHIVRLAPVLIAAAAAWRVFAAGSALFKGAQMVGTFLRIGPAIGSTVTALGAFTSGFRSSAAAASAFSGTAGTLGGALRSVVNATVAGIAAFGRWVAAATVAAGRAVATGAAMVAGWVRAGAAAAASAAVQVGAWLRTAATAVASGARIAAAWVMSLGPIGLVIAAIAGVVGAFVLAYNKCGWFRDGVNAAMGNIRRVTGAVVAFVRYAWSNVWEAAKGFTRGFLFGVVGFMGSVRRTVSGVASAVRALWSAAWSAAARSVGGFVGRVSSGMAAARRVIDGVANAARNVMDAVGRASSAMSSWSWFGSAALAATPAAELPAPGVPFTMTAGVISAPSLGTGSSRPVPSTTIVNIHVDGALDAPSVARQIRSILRSDGIRDGRISIGDNYL